MKLKLLLFIGLLFCSSAFLQAQTDGTATFTFTHAQPEVWFSEDFVAVWVEHSDGTFIKTKMRYVEQENDHLPAFALAAGGGANCLSNSIDITDATTGATLGSGGGAPAAWDTYIVVWDGKDLSGTLVTDGDYTFFVESAWIDGPGDQSDYLSSGFTFTKGLSDQSLTPADDGVIGSVTLNWVANTLGIGDNTLANNNILVYPNPSNGVFNINFNNNLVNKLEVIDVLGRSVYQENLNSGAYTSSKSLDLSNNVKGIYILRFYSDSGTSSRKIIIGK